MITPINSFPPVTVQPFEGVNTNINEENRATLTNEQLQEQKRSESISRTKQQERAEKPETNINDFEKLSDKLNELLKSENLAIEFLLDKDTKKMIMKIIDSNTKEVLQQIPPEIAIKIARIVARTLAETPHIANTTA